MSKVVFDPAEIDFESRGKRTYELAIHLDGAWGYVLLPLTVINGYAGSAKCIACFGGTHGDEYEGQVAVRRLVQDLDPAEMKGRVLLMPRLNPPACEDRRRESPLDGGNMNRAFPGDPAGTITFRIAHFVTKHILTMANVVVDAHAGGAGMEFAMLTSFHAIDDPMRRKETRTVAGLFDTPFTLVYSRDLGKGLLVEQAEQQGCIVVGGEFGHGAGVSYVGVRHVYEGIRNILKVEGMLPGEVLKIDSERTTPPRLVEAVHLSDYVPAPISGVFEPVVPLGARLEAGEPIGRLHDFEHAAAPALELNSPHDGWLIMNRFQAPVPKGSTLFVVAREARSLPD